MLRVLRRYRAARDRLLALPFVTITDYLFELRAISRAMHRVGTNGLLYLAAAVSDFFLPVRLSRAAVYLSSSYTNALQPERMSEHKIQSTDIQLDTEKPVARNEDEEMFDNFDSYAL